ncbi:MAG TPA: SUF system Fe-S cluster assembly protein [Gemmataceae bacterium]|nr:SUF system Fe-S cluster assembly protein [Gemmataceae bacterium]
MDSKPQRIPLPSVPPEPPAAPTHSPTAPSTEAGGTAAAPVDLGEVREKVVEALTTCYDPEIPVNIHELGLIYDVDISDAGAVTIRMTLTSPACPAAASLPPEVEQKVRQVPGVSAARVEVVWDPPWTPERMSEAARVQLGLF